MNNDDLDFGWDGPTAGAGQNNAAPAAKPTNNAPTEKRLAFAKRLMEERPGTKPPAGWDTDWRVCAAFINEMLKTPAQKIANGRDMKPTPKRLAFAEQLLSERPGTKEPEGWRDDWRICSRFIDEMLKVKVARGSSPKSPPAPSTSITDEIAF